MKKHFPLVQEKEKRGGDTKATQQDWNGAGMVAGQLSGEPYWQESPEKPRFT